MMPPSLLQEKKVHSENMQLLDNQVRTFLARMGLDTSASEEGFYMFKYGSTAVMITLIEQGDHTLVRLASTLLTEVSPNVGLVRRILQFNAEVLFGSFLLFEDNTLSFAATLLGRSLQFEDFAFALNYVADISDVYDDKLQQIAGGQRALDVYGEA